MWRRSWWTCCANCPLSTTCPSWLIIEWRPRRFTTWAPPTSRRCVCSASFCLGCSIFFFWFYFLKCLSWLSFILTGSHLIGPGLVSAPASVYEHQHQIINLQHNETENLFISLHYLVTTSALLNIKDEIVTRDRAQPGSWSSSVLDRFLLLTDQTKLYIWCCYFHKSGKIRKTGRCCFDGLYSEGEWCLDLPSSLSSWHSHLQVSILQLDHVAFKDNLSVTFKALFFWIHGAMSHPGLWNHQLYGILCFQLGINEAGIQKALLNWARERQPEGTVHTSHHSWALVTL